MTMLPLKKIDDDVHELVAVRQVVDQRGQPPIQAGLHAHYGAEDVPLVRTDPHLGPQVVHGAAVERKEAHIGFAEVQRLVRTQVPDYPPPIRLRLSVLQEQEASAAPWFLLQWNCI